MGSWIWCICIGSVGMFFVVLNYIALIRSKREGRFISGFPLIGGILLFLAFFLSPVRWLSVLCLLDYGIWTLPFVLIREAIIGKRQKSKTQPEKKTGTEDL
ncbi:hypothetical protein [Ruminococcus sp.]|uniref:hypothetical protein n=1 Tax=Ruminococcus sp. TaxID=41978 RepID=UPI003F08354E